MRQRRADRTWTTAVAAATAALALSACAAGQAGKAKPSGFLGDYGKLHAGTEGQALLVYRDPNAQFAKYTKLMIDMQVVAWQTDMTRVASLMLGRDGSNRSYREIGISDGHHSISHHQGDGEKLDKLIKIDELHVSMFAYLLERLKATPDGDGTLLDHSLVLFGSSISESNIHTHDDLPIVLAGRANGQLQSGRHLVYPKETPLNNLFLNMFGLAGVPHVDGLGDSTGRLTDL